MGLVVLTAKEDCMRAITNADYTSKHSELAVSRRDVKCHVA